MASPPGNFNRYWNALVGDGGRESECGWCADMWGVSRQITPRLLMDWMAEGGAIAKVAFAAMTQIRTIDIATIETAIKLARADA